MKIAGIIAEYNPFHKGHAYHINETKKRCGADYVVVVMSGSFVQRGEPACFDKYTRAHMALCEGADLVLELPALYATSSAEGFARGGISVLHGLGCIDTVSFGCEDADLHLLELAASLLEHESEEFKQHLNEGLKKGLTFPAARAAALEKELGNASTEILAKPNNILAIEYLRALRLFESHVAPFAFQRCGDYHSLSLDNEFSSASAIRSFLEEHSASESAIYLPAEAARVLLNERPPFLTADDFSDILTYRLLALRNGDFSEFLDVSTDLSMRIKKELTHISTYRSFSEHLKTKQMTRTRINRALLHIILGISGEFYEQMKEEQYPSYARILGFRKASSEVLSEIKKKSAIPVISKMADAHLLLKESETRLLDLDIFSSDLYEAVSARKRPAEHVRKNEFTHPIILV